MKQIFKILLAISLMFSFSYAGWMWDATKNVGKAGMVYGAKKGYDVYKKSKASKSPTKHSVQQKINREVASKDELDALKNPLQVKEIKYDDYGRPSQRYTGEKAEVVVNPNTNNIISVNPTSTRKANKLKGLSND